jgi:hypothetical protein
MWHAYGRSLCGENKISRAIVGRFIIGIASLILLPFIIGYYSTSGYIIKYVLMIFIVLYSADKQVAD